MHGVGPHAGLGTGEGPAGTPSACRAIASSPTVTCSPEATTMSYSAGSKPLASSPSTKAHELVGLAGHGREHDAEPLAQARMPRHALRHMANPL